MSPLFGPDAGRVQLKGTRTPGTIVGIEVNITSDDDAAPYTDYAVEAGGTVYGIRQDLAPADEVRLGMPVTLLVDGTAAVIEWGDSGTYRWKMLKKPPAAGIVDDLDSNGNRGAMKRIRRGTAVAVTLLEFSVRKVALGLSEAVDATVRAVPDGGEPFEATVTALNKTPGYAAHLPVIGATLPGWIRDGLRGRSIVIDWAAAANADPGLGRPPARLPGGGGLMGRLGDGAASSVAPGRDGGAAPAPALAPAPAIPAFAQKLLAKAGLPEAPRADAAGGEGGGVAGAGGGSGGEDDVVSWETFLDVQHQIDWGPLKKKEIEGYAVSRGVPAGEWPAAQRRWQLRMVSDPAKVTEYGQRMSRP